MIPRRIALKGFLCYRDEQVIDFDGADLWVLSGRNGSGKSAVFDAMTSCTKSTSSPLARSRPPEPVMAMVMGLSP